MKLFSKSIVPYGLVVLMSSAVCGCGSSGDKNGDSLTPAARQHAALRASLRDSAAFYSQSAAEIESELDSVKSEFEILVSGMDATDRGDYVEIYRVAKGWRGYDTMAGTGVLARLLENGDVEVVASSASGPFSSVTLSADGESVVTKPVKEGGGLNYTVGNITRVTFIGADALALCDFAEEHKGETMTLSYVGAKTSVLKLSSSQADMLAFFGRITAVKKRLDTLERAYMVAFNKQMLYQSEVRKDSTEAAATTGK